jgi:hypothetical protein
MCLQPTPSAVCSKDKEIFNNLMLSMLATSDIEREYFAYKAKQREDTLNGREVEKNEALETMYALYKLNSTNPAIDAINNYTRSKLRESGIMRRIMPPVLCNEPVQTDTDMITIKDV